MWIHTVILTELSKLAEIAALYHHEQIAPNFIVLSFIAG
jgi:hypothetical protein